MDLTPNPGTGILGAGILGAGIPGAGIPGVLSTAKVTEKLITRDYGDNK